MIEKPECFAIKSDGTIAPVEPGVGVTLGVGTWFVPVNAPDAPTETIHFMWDAAVVATSINYQDCNAPRYKRGNYKDSGDDVSDIDQTSGHWVTQDPSTAYVPAGAGYTVTNMTVAVAGGTANGTVFELGNLGTKRGRMKVVLTTGGKMRFLPHAKAA